MFDAMWRPVPLTRRICFDVAPGDSLPVARRRLHEIVTRANDEAKAIDDRVERASRGSLPRRDEYLEQYAKWWYRHW
jgi:hypothetical protein